MPIENRHNFAALILVTAQLTLGVGLASADNSTAKQPRPNIVVIVGDDMGYADVGFHGCQDIPTPNLDALAAAGVRCTDGYVSGPYCSPTRAGLMTGRYQQRFGHEFNPSGPQGLPLTETTLANRLKSAGYTTGMVGKWHLGSAPGMHPMERGFDEFFGFLSGAHDYFQDDGILRGKQRVDEKEYLTDAFGREAEAFIDGHSKDGKPWFLYLTFNAVHTPMQADDARMKKFENIEKPVRRTYAAMMSAMDDAIGRVRKKIADVGAEKNTIVMFISDNGGPTMEGVTVNGSINKPLRGSKRTTLEGGIRVPYVVAWPGKIQPAVYQQPVIQLDLTYTALTAAGADAPTDGSLDGVDLLPYFAGQKTGAPHESLFWRFGQQMAIRRGDFKLVRYDLTADGLPLPKGEKFSAVKLYNLADDLSETKDLAASMPDKVRELQAEWDAWNKTLAAPLWGGGVKVGEEGKPGGKAARKAAKKAAK
jgi:arylsulfatase A-like enzyme